MAVIVRSGAQVPAVARALGLAEVPTRTSSGGIGAARPPRRQEPAAVVDVGIGRTPLTAELAGDLLLGPFGGLDRLALRRLRLALRAEELAGDGRRSGDELLVDALSAPGRLVSIDSRVAETPTLAATLGEVRALAASGGTIEELLWLVWTRGGLADAWRAQALGTGILAAEANTNLDGVLALFTAATRFVERQPDSGPSVFLEAVLDAEVPEDTLSPRSGGDRVLVTTPSGAIGLEFEVVALLGVQDGIWPNLKSRGSLLYPGEFARVVSGQPAAIDARKEVLHDELRMFALAVSRARAQVIVSAVANDDAAASVFFALLPNDAVTCDPALQPPLSLRGLTAALRRELTAPAASARRVRRHPHWRAWRRSSSRGRPGAVARHTAAVEPGAALRRGRAGAGLAPSKLELFEQSPLDWFIQSVSGSSSSTAMGIGTIVHWAMETANRSERRRADRRHREPLERAGLRVAVAGRTAEAGRPHPRRGLAEYLADFARAGKQLVAAEGRFSLSVGRATVNGSIDRVERSGDGSVVIVDLKTGSAITKQEAIAAHPQLGVYQLAYAAGVLTSPQTGGAPRRRRQTAVRQKGCSRQGLPRGHPAAAGRGTPRGIPHPHPPGGHRDGRRASAAASTSTNGAGTPRRKPCTG